MSVTAACIGTLAMSSASVADHAAGAIELVDSANNNAAAAALGPLKGYGMYLGTWQGADTEDWLHYWHHPGLHGPIAFSSQCPTRVELYSTSADTFSPAAALAQFDVTAEKVTHSYATSETVMRRVLVRVVRTDGGSAPCVWTAEPKGSSNAFGREPTAPKLTLNAQRKSGRTAAIVVRAQIPGRYGDQRPARISVSGIVSRTIDIPVVPRSGVVTRRVDLPAGRKGSVRVRVSVPATARKPAMPDATRVIKVSTIGAGVRQPKPVVRRPIVRRPPPSKRPTVRTPASAVRAFIRNPPSGMKSILREAKFSGGYELGRTRGPAQGWAKLCARSNTRSDPAFPNNPTGEYLSLRFFTYGTKAPRVVWVEGPNFIWPATPGRRPAPQWFYDAGGGNCPSRPN